MHDPEKRAKANTTKGGSKKDKDAPKKDEIPETENLVTATASWLFKNLDLTSIPPRLHIYISKLNVYVAQDKLCLPPWRNHH